MNQTTNIRKPDIKISIGARTRVTLLFTVFLLSHLASFGQIKTPKIEKPHIETPNKDSLNTEIKNKVDEKKQQAGIRVVAVHILTLEEQQGRRKAEAIDTY